VDDLHAAIAAHLRRQRPPGPPGAPPHPLPPQAPDSSFTCRFCTRRIRQGDAADSGFHFAELWAAVSCASCHRERLDQEAERGGPWTLLQGWYSASQVKPHCQHCGKTLWTITDSADERRQRAARICGKCADAQPRQGA